MPHTDRESIGPASASSGPAWRHFWLRTKRRAPPAAARAPPSELLLRLPGQWGEPVRIFRRLRRAGDLWKRAARFRSLLSADFPETKGARWRSQIRQRGQRIELSAKYAKLEPRGPSSFSFSAL